MKKGNVEITKNTGSIAKGYRIEGSSSAWKGLYTEQDLKDLRDCIDTVLGEEGHTLGTHFDCKRCLKEHTMASLVQPLTEGEEKCGLTERECRLLGGNCYDEPQESNKEEEFDTEWMKGKSLSELLKEPSKKPSITIGCGECGNNIKI